MPSVWLGVILSLFKNDLVATSSAHMKQILMGHLEDESKYNMLVIFLNNNDTIAYNYELKSQFFTHAQMLFVFTYKNDHQLNMHFDNP